MVGNKAEKCLIFALISRQKYRFLSYISEIPLTRILDDFNIIFKEWKNYNNTYFEKDNEAFELMVTKQYVRVDCYGIKAYNMNKIIDIMNKYDCPLYDSAIDVRFDETE